MVGVFWTPLIIFDSIVSGITYTSLHISVVLCILSQTWLAMALYNEALQVWFLTKIEE